MADITLDLTRPHAIRLVRPVWLRARLRLLRRNLRRDLFAFGKGDQLLADIGRPRADRYDWLSALMCR